jgi:hypothetical protein
MGFKNWADKQVRKRDIRAAIEETHFQRRMLQGLAVVLTVTETDEAILQEFDKHHLEYFAGLVCDLRDSGARLWGFKGDSTEWTNSQDMIATSRVLWNEDRRERLIVAEVLTEDLRRRIEEVYLQFESARLTAEEARTVAHSTIDSFCEHCANHSKRLEEEAVVGGLVKPRDVTKLKERAEKRVGSVMRKAMREGLSYLVASRCCSLSVGRAHLSMRWYSSCGPIHTHIKPSSSSTASAL